MKWPFGNQKRADICQPDRNLLDNSTLHFSINCSRIGGDGKNQKTPIPGSCECPFWINFVHARLFYGYLDWRSTILFGHSVPEKRIASRYPEDFAKFYETNTDFANFGRKKKKEEQRHKIKEGKNEWEKKKEKERNRKK